MDLREALKRTHMALVEYMPMVTHHLDGQEIYDVIFDALTQRAASATDVAERERAAFVAGVQWWQAVGRGRNVGALVEAARQFSVDAPAMYYPEGELDKIKRGLPQSWDESTDESTPP